MQFITDQQTLEDLNLLGKYKKNSVFSLFNQTVTLGGERLLESMFHAPFTDVKEINKRIQIITFFRAHDFDWPIDTDDLEEASSFANGFGQGNLFQNFLRACRRKLLNIMGLKEEDAQLTKETKAVVRLLADMKRFAVQLYQSDTEQLLVHTPLHNTWLVNNAELDTLLHEISQKEDFSLLETTRYDYTFRNKWADAIEMVFKMIHYLDAFRAIAQVANDLDMTMPVALSADTHTLVLGDVRHPGIPNAIGNDVYFEAEHNLLFLTGANMAGKSTFMKSFGIAVYLAHMGFPVAARAMRFSVRDGLYSSINVADNLDMGYSHYYAEVLRVKKVAEAVASGHNMVVVFDELFKGTNVKDAYEATLAVTEAFQQHTNCQYIVSTHIVEVGEKLKDYNRDITFQYMPTVMEGSRPTYTYRAKEGISADKHGLLIINNEGVLELLDKSKQQ